MKQLHWSLIGGSLALALVLGAPGVEAATQETEKVVPAETVAQAEPTDAEVDDPVELTEGLVVVRDPESGEVRQASPHEMQELRQQLRLDRRSSKPAKKLKATRHRNGMDSIVLDESFMVFTIVERDADGRFVIVKHGKGPEPPELPDNRPPER